MENYRQLYESMFNKNLADDDAFDFLLDITEKYPFFSPAQFLLLHKTAKTDAGYKQQLMKTAAAFNNNYWLNYLLLQQDKEAFIESYSAEETIADTALQDTIINVNEPSEQPITANEVILPDEQEVIKEAADINTNELQESVLQPEIIIPIQEETDEAGDEQEQSLNEENALPITDETSSKEQELTAEVKIENAPVTSEGGEMNITAEEMNHADETIDKTTEDSFSSEAINTAFDNKVGDDDEVIPNEETNGINDESQQDADYTEQDQEDTAEEENFTSPLKTDLAEAAAILDTKPVENGPLFEPLHTTDYFASVGIKLSDEIKPGDRLGSQLKSFTEWLKTMKKLHPTQTGNAAETSDKQNSNIMQLAENSNKEDEIITEAMADVLMQQGRIDKAVEVLKKLSLLNPSKNTYFAAKIDKLKEE